MNPSSFPDLACVDRVSPEDSLEPAPPGGPLRDLYLFRQAARSYQTLLAACRDNQTSILSAIRRTGVAAADLASALGMRPGDLRMASEGKVDLSPEQLEKLYEAWTEAAADEPKPETP